MNQINRSRGDVDLFNVKGRMVIRHYTHKRGVWRKEFDEENEIGAGLKIAIRDNLHAADDFAMDFLFDTDGQKGGGGGHAAGDPVGKDGILIYEGTILNTHITMITTVHPSDPSGDYYKQWQGILTNDFGLGAFVVGRGSGISGAFMGADQSGGAAFGHRYASQKFAIITMAPNDILTIDWKVSLS